MTRAVTPSHIPAPTLARSATTAPALTEHTPSPAASPALKSITIVETETAMWCAQRASTWTGSSTSLVRRRPSLFHQRFNLSTVRNAGSLRFRHYLIIACCSLSNADLLVLLGFFGTTDGQVDIDGSGDGVCSVADLLQMLIYFGGRCDSRG